MKPSFLHISFLLLTFLFLPFFAAQKVEAKIYAYKLFDPMTVPQPSMIGGGRVAWWTEYSFDAGIMNHGGRMILSRNPDGTGDARVGDTLQVWANNPAHGSYIFTYNAYRTNCFFEDPPAMPPQDITPYFPVINDPYDVTVRILDWCGKEKYTDSLYLVNITNDPSPTPTPTPQVSTAPKPSPQRVPPKPFLDLPWNYRAHGLSFSDAALKIESFFDHEYPVLSASLREPSDSIVKFDGSRTTDPYSSHDGYDYAKRADALLGDPVLAAAAGIAQYVGSCEACGNMIVIDHGNGFQTRYMHLLKDGLAVSKENSPIAVSDRQPIGKIGFTGNVVPPGDLGAHIHFMVVEDKNRDGNFSDNIPDGVTDPFGWQSALADPWETHQFSQASVNRVGNRSTYLFRNQLDTTQKTVTPQKTETVAIPHLSVSFPPGTADQAYTVQANATAYSNKNTSLISVGNAFLLSAYNDSQAAITAFKKAFTIRIEFNKSELEMVKKETLAIFSSEDGFNWRRETTAVDLNHAAATTSVDHMTYFALLGERHDTTPPVTKITARVKKDHEVVLLAAHDTPGGSGVDYSVFRIDGGEWTKYTKRITLSTGGTHTVEYYSVDRDGNREKTHTYSFGAGISSRRHTTYK
ncbi:M23 family metallopeptidase [Candidatus Microgenomates bacterium]|nr:M23 family metallopeptidase [Candidatus Microgenomates bacterium]